MLSNQFLNLDLAGELSLGMVAGLPQSLSARSLIALECRDWTDGDVLICKWPPEDRESFFTGDSFPSLVPDTWKRVQSSSWFYKFPYVHLLSEQMTEVFMCRRKIFMKKLSQFDLKRYRKCLAGSQSIIGVFLQSQTWGPKYILQFYLSNLDRAVSQSIDVSVVVVVVVMVLRSLVSCPRQIN